MIKVSVYPLFRLESERVQIKKDHDVKVTGNSTEASYDKVRSLIEEGKVPGESPEAKKVVESIPSDYKLTCHPRHSRVQTKVQCVKILFNPILSYFFGKILFCPIFWEMSYFLAILPLISAFYGLFITISYENIP